MARIWQKDLFDENGHLTDDTLVALIHSSADNAGNADDAVDFNELQRLEIAEHLSFCDKCVLRYTELMTDEALLTPSDLVVPGVMNRLEKEARRQSFSKWASMIMAASFAILFWVAGVFSPNFADLDTGFLTEIMEGATAFSRQTVEISTEITDSMGNWMEKLNWRGELSHGKE